MAANTGGKSRDSIKWVRDRAKSAYVKQPYCFICGCSESLELHHTHSLTNLFDTWVKKNNISIVSDQDVIEVRDDFINQHHGEIYTEVYTLCIKHHLMLHSLYGKAPPLHTANKQASWIQTQKDKFNGITSTREPSGVNWLKYRVDIPRYQLKG